MLYKMSQNQAACVFFRVGACRHGEGCRFSHDPAAKTPICRFGTSSNCPNGHVCLYQHTDQLASEDEQKSLPDELPPENTFHVAVGSTSAIKLQALKACAFFASNEEDGTNAKMNVIVEGVDVGGDVRPQPVGKEETEKGARNRALNAQKSKPFQELYVGIENGMFEVDQKWVDAACCVFMLKQVGGDGAYEESLIWSDSILIPDGMEKGPNGEWSVLKDPHTEITKGERPRSKFLSDCIQAWINDHAHVFKEHMSALSSP